MKVLATHVQQNETNEQYKEEFESIWEIVEQFGGSLTNHPELIERRAAEIAALDEPPRDVGEVDDDDREMAATEIANEIKASFMLSGAQERRYGGLKLQLENDYTLGNDRYPKDTEGVLGLMNNYRDPYQRRQYRTPDDRGGQPKEEDGLQFVQEGTNEGNEGAVMAQQGKKPGGETKTNSKGESNCFHCGAKDHWITDCPDLNEANKGSLMMQLDGALISQLKKCIRSGGLRRNYLYLDTCTTNNQVVNPAYLKGVHKADTPLHLHTNAGTSVLLQQGYLGEFLFWLDPHGIANVISLRTLEEKHKVTYDSELHGGAFVVHTDEGDVIFRRCPETGFPYIDLDENASEAAMLVQSVRGNFEGFTKREVKGAIAARDLQANMGHISDTNLERLIKKKDDVSQSNILHDCPVTADDLQNAKIIFGPSLPQLKGKSVREKPVRAEPGYTKIPLEIIERNRFVTLVADVMFVGGLPFLISLSRRIRFVTVQFMPRRTAGELCNGLKAIVNLYKRAGFICQAALMDNEFEPLKTHLLDTIDINTTAKNEHVGEIERKIRHVKDHARCVRASLPFKHVAMPKAIINAMIHHIVLWLNAFVSPQGISTQYSPRELVLR
eukprot:scaffold248363_cov77-Cyclotella_meneghiniana.AAC.3